MKISKLAIAALLTSMVLTGCNVGKKSSPSSDAPSSSEPSSSGSQINPVTKIRVTALGRTLVVGDQFNLDDYVEVVGGEGPKVYTAAVTTGASVVSIEGKTVSAIGEGEFSITVSAGEKTGTLSGSVMSALRAAFKDYVDSFPTSGYAIQEQKYSGGEIVDKPDALIYHEDDYFGHYAKSQSDPKVGGYLKSADGNIYGWSASDIAGTNFKAIPGPVAPVSRWENYFCNTPLFFSFDDFKMTDYPESTEQLLAIDDTVACEAGLEDYFNNAIDQLIWCGLQYDLEDYVDKVLYVHAEEKEQGGFDFSFELLFTDDNDTPEDTSDDHQYGLPFRFILGESSPKLAFVQEYVDSGEHPEAVNFSQLTDKIAALNTAKNYTITYSTYWLQYGTWANLDWPTALGKYGLVFGAPDETYGKWVENQGFFRSLDETAVVTENGTYHSVVEKKYFDASWDPYVTPVSTTTISGLIKHNDVVYNYSKADGAVAYESEATTSTSVWGGDFSDQLASGLVLESTFEAKSNTHDDVKNTDTISYADSSVAKEMKKILNQTASGPLFDAGFAEMWQAGAQYLGYFDIDATVAADSLLFETYFIYSSSAPVLCIDVEITNIGSSVLPVTEVDIFGA